jgi:hypothetical protein
MPPTSTPDVIAGLALGIQLSRTPEASMEWTTVCPRRMLTEHAIAGTGKAVRKADEKAGYAAS